MPEFSGSYIGRVASQSASSVPDQADHVLALAVIPTKQTCTDPLWNGATMTYCATSDTVAGNGIQRGYFTNERAGGDRDYGSFEGKLTAAGDSVTVEGTWQHTGGTGKFAKIKGNGTYKARMTSPVDVEGAWSGNYEL